MSILVFIIILLIGKLIPEFYFRHIFSDISKLQSLGWKPSYGVEDSITDYWEYINSHEDIDNILAYAEKHMEDLQVIRKVPKST